MGFFAPRIPVRLREEIDRLAVQPLRPAEICRAIGEYAEEQGIRRPCYQQVRLLVCDARQRPQRVSTAKVLLDVALRVHHPDAFLQHVSGTQTRFKNK
jgi:hypothetical protein